MYAAPSNISLGVQLSMYVYNCTLVLNVCNLIWHKFYLFIVVLFQLGKFSEKFYCDGDE